MSFNPIFGNLSFKHWWIEPNCWIVILTQYAGSNQQPNPVKLKQPRVSSVHIWPSTGSQIGLFLTQHLLVCV